MSLRESSGVPQSNSPTAKVSSAVPGGHSQSNGDATEIRANLPHRHPLQFLINLISKSSNQNKSAQRKD